ncbi:MAG: MFS transporter [Comamonadaceae bacterium]|nr:MAG: MFS transporter [Comamonadaceae bacterium]
MWPKRCSTGAASRGREAGRRHDNDPVSSTPTNAYDRRFVGWLSLGQLISWGSIFYMFALVMEPVEQELGLGRAEASLGFSLALMAEGLLAYPVGRWIDRGHERAVMTGGSLLVVAGMVLLSMAQSAAGFWLAWLCLGAAMSATLYAPSFAVVTRRFPQDFRRAIITLTFLGGLASTVFIPLTSWLITQVGWRHALWALALIHLLVCVPLHWIVLRRHKPSQTVQATTAARDTATAGSSVAPAGQLQPLSHYLRSAPFLLIGVFVVLMMAITSALPAHMISLLRENGLGEAWVIVIPASIGVIQVLGRALLYFFEHHFDVHMANRIIPCLIPLGLAALLAGGGHGWAAVLFVGLYGMGNGMMTIVKGTAIAQYVNRQHVASLNGALGLPLAFARALAPLLLGVLWSRDAGYRYGLWLMLVSAIVAVVALLMAQRRALPTG